MLTTRTPDTAVDQLHVLIVDGPSRSGRRLRRRLRGVPGWTVDVARTASTALTTLHNSTVDVVLTELHPRAGSAPEILRQVKAAVPGCVRILLSDGSHRRGGGLSRLVHQTLPLDVEPDDLILAIGQVTGVLNLLGRHDVRSLVTEVDRLPGAPRLHLELAELTEDPNVSMTAIAAVVEKDAAIASKILQLVNSAFFGRSVRTADLTEAATFLGVTALRGLVLQNELMRTFRSSDAARNRFLEDFARHGYDVGMRARDLVPTHQAADAFTAGLLHDIGQVVIASQRPYEWERIRAEVAATHEALPAVERAHLGVSHAELGAALLALWGLPYPVVEAVAHHHEPRTRPGNFGLTGAVHVADATENHGGVGPSFDHGTELDADWVAHNGPTLDAEA